MAARATWSRRESLAAFGAALLAGCARAAPFAIGYQRGGLLLLAKARGTIDAALTAAGHAPATWVEFPSGPPMLEAMAAGSIDIGATGESPPIFAQAAGAPITYIAAEPISGLSSAILVRTASAFHTLADLRGRRIGFTKASSAHLVLAKALARAGMRFADIMPVNLAPNEAASAFAAGAIDAWSTWDPYYALVEARGDGRAIVTGDQLPATDAFIVGNRTTLAAKRDELRVALGTLRQEAAWARNHTDAVVAAISRLSGLPANIARASLRRGEFAEEPIGAAVIARQQANADLFAALGLLPHKVDVASAVWTQ